MLIYTLRTKDTGGEKLEIPKPPTEIEEEIKQLQEVFGRERILFEET
jgi:hypothetical protein